jgi:hypothetical protein
MSDELIWAANEADLALTAMILVSVSSKTRAELMRRRDRVRAALINAGVRERPTTKIDQPTRRTERTMESLELFFWCNVFVIGMLILERVDFLTEVFAR